MNEAQDDGIGAYVRPIGFVLPAGWVLLQCREDRLRMHHVSCLFKVHKTSIQELF